MDILGPRPKTLSDNQFDLVMKEGYLKLMSALLTSKTTTSHMASLIGNKWLILYRFPSHVLISDGMQFISELFETLCVFVNTKFLTTPAYHLQASEHAGCFDKRIIARLRHCVTEHQRDWDI